MPSEQHQALVRVMAQKMVLDGFAITHWDGRLPQAVGGGGVPLPLPLSLGAHRPDLMGFNRQRSVYAFGEAKTIGDIGSQRTARQFRDFSSWLMTATGHRCQLYIAVPRSALNDLRRVLVAQCIHGRSNVHILAVPDVLVPQRGDDLG